ncbi:hypothetical protein O6P43_017395 [Quillaja saponaria]|uniref:Uncharacterized protein n=1 Tax=Quillaja saponaria TaxID=32244 RepID=A0AAD7PNB1_QUISA|nr:hypothetical protein O6P43_017395 [Quillaja saponaria]
MSTVLKTGFTFALGSMFGIVISRAASRNWHREGGHDGHQWRCPKQRQDNKQKKTDASPETLMEEVKKDTVVKYNSHYNSST